MFNEIKEKAIKLRKKGYSVNRIAKDLKKSKSTISIWVRDVELTEEQKKELRDKNPIFNPLLRGCGGTNVVKVFYNKLREKYRKTGRELAIKNQKNTNFVAGLMLYWAEGYRSNNKSTVKFTNTQMEMVKFFLSFLKKYFNVKNSDIKISVYYHEGQRSITEIQNYWLANLSLNPTNLNRPYLENKRNITNKRKNRYPYGICNLIVYKTEILQQIYGAIQEYIGFEKPDWNV
jgi:Homeodomain-like domain